MNVSTQAILNVVTKAPPPMQRRTANMKEKSATRLKIESLKPGECLELRALTEKEMKNIVGGLYPIRKKTGKKFTSRVVGSNGLDIYCIG